MSPAAADATRLRLLEIAGPLFAQHGYRDTGVATICAAAGCNVAAINYHFGGKQAFYAAVLAHAHASKFAALPMPASDDGAPPEEVFAAWLRWWVRSLLDPRGPSWVQTLISREIVDPTPALDAMVERSIRPMFERFAGFVRRLLPPRTPARVVRECVFSVIGQALFYKHASPVITRLGAAPDLTPRGLDRLADHIATVSLGGIAAIARREAAARATPRRQR